MREIVILGTGGLGRETHEAARACGRKVIGFLDDDAGRHGALVHERPVLGATEWLRAHPDVEVAIAIGSPAARARVRRRLDAMGHAAYATIVHPRAVVGERVHVGEGSIILQAASLTTDIRMGRHVIVNPGATLAHDDVVHDFVLVTPGAAISGNVTLGEGADVGTNAAILQGLSVGAWAVVGAGAVVTRDVPPDSTVVGVPARVLGTRPNGWQMHL